MLNIHPSLKNISNPEICIVYINVYLLLVFHVVKAICRSTEKYETICRSVFLNAYDNNILWSTFRLTLSSCGIFNPLVSMGNLVNMKAIQRFSYVFSPCCGNYIINEADKGVPAMMQDI